MCRLSLSSLLMFCVLFGGAFVTAGAGVPVVLLVHFPAKSWATYSHGRIARSGIDISTILRTRSRFSDLLALSSSKLLLVSPLPLERCIIIDPGEFRATWLLSAHAAVLCLLPAGDPSVDDFDTLLDKFIPIHLLRAPVVTKTAAKDLL